MKILFTYCVSNIVNLIMILLFFNSKYYEVYKVGCEASMATLKLKGCGVSPSINISAENGILDVGNALVGDSISTTLKVPHFALFLQSMAFHRIDSVGLRQSLLTWVRSSSKVSMSQVQGSAVSYDL